MTVPELSAKYGSIRARNYEELESLSKKIAQIVEAVDYIHAKHVFFSEFLHVRDAVVKHVHALLPEHTSWYTKILSSFNVRPRFSIKKVIQQTQCRTLEVLHMDQIIERLQERWRLKKERKAQLQRAVRAISTQVTNQVVKPLYEVSGIAFWSKVWSRVRLFSLHVIAVLGQGGRIVVHHMRTLTVFAVIFGGVFLLTNIEAMSEIGTNYIKTDSFAAPYFQAREARESHIKHATLSAAPSEMIAAEEEKTRIGEQPSLSPLNIVVTPDDNRIEIPRIGRNLPLRNVADEKVIYSKNPQDTEDAIQEALKGGVVRYPGTARPGERGNVFLTGHSSYYLWAPGEYKDAFALLTEVEIGDEIVVYYGGKKGDQKRYVYKVTNIKEVQPDEVDVLKQTDDYRLTLMTCVPIGTNLRRLIVTATQVQ